MAATTTVARPAPASHSSSRLALAAFKGLLLRDLTALRKSPGEFLARTIVQPLLLVLVLGYINPKIGLGPSSGAGAVGLSTTLVAGMLAIVILFQGIQGVAIPLVREFGFTREIEDRVLAPIPVGLVALEKVVAGALQGLLAALVVFPIAVLVPAAAPDLAVDWPVLLTLAPLAALACSSLGLAFGTSFDPRSVMALFAVLLTPIMFLGCTLYPWSSLDSLRWVQLLSLANPLTYVSEGFRAAVTPADHLALPAVYAALAGYAALFLWIGLRNFRRRVTA
jgi:ABC-2 type transport system permease protein